MATDESQGTATKMTRAQYLSRKRKFTRQLKLALKEMDQAEKHRFRAQWKLDDLEEKRFLESWYKPKPTQETLPEWLR